MKILAFLLISLFLRDVVVAHEGEKHNDSSSDVEKSENMNMENQYRKINNLYTKQVKPIFQKSCYNCHSMQVEYPWYYVLPGVKQLIDSDIHEARKHLVFTGNFPFEGHGSPQEDLKAIGRVISNDTMPPLRYQVMHWESFLNSSEKKQILTWIKKAKEILGISSEKKE